MVVDNCKNHDPLGGILIILLNDGDMYIIMQNVQSSY